MKSDYCEALKINKNATGFWEMFEFVTEGDEEKQARFIDKCKSKNRREIELHTFSLRKKRLKENRFNSSDEFVSFFKKDKKNALQQLFQEPLNHKKISLLQHDPAHLYNIHSKSNFDIWYMECLLYV
ncbi:hypothetical protein SAMN04487895_101639 [Paenibacillus sophorae]|uniref:Uncharacterized protein n=1 Tax=Paenibacillus sophorae TaxID=1333845 RepID=A0A1H8GU16_9BACL|nr:hypothetical protein [Paenibacillus sophorae]QWU14337.1 hypothetical protein KP014_20740 [Paenibacillus sophorae]SEN47269.1 hypothetical protein SAMN04487895_101639 [Paenibacillus sophorae]